MAHTCPGCCLGGHRRKIAPTIDDRFVEVKSRLRPNHNYRHDYGSWKTTTKARKQYLRHALR